METMLPLPINNLSSNPAGAVQPPAESTEGGDFSQVLAQYLGEKADGKRVSEDRGLENLDSSALANLLAGLAVGNPSFISQEMGTSSGNGLSDLKEDSSSVANALLEVYAQGKGQPGIQRETFAGLQSPFSSIEKGAFFASPLPSGEEKQGELPVGADRLGNFMPSSISSMEKGAFFASPFPSGEEKQGKLPVGSDPLGSFILSPLPSENEERTGQRGWVDPAQNPVAGVTPQAQEGSVLPEGELEKTSPGRFSIPPREIRPATAGEIGPGKVEPFDSPAPKKEIAVHPWSKDRTNGESLLPAGGVEIKRSVDASAGSNPESPFLSRQERSSGAEPPSIIRRDSVQTSGGEKYSMNEEGPAPSNPTQPSAPQNTGWELLSRSHEEREGLQVSGMRSGQTHSSGKENQTSLGFYGASSPPTASSFGFAEKVAEGKEALAPMPVEPRSVTQQVGERVLWLIRNQEEKIRISLDPPELGHLCLEIHRTKDNIQTTLYTDNPLTKATLESSQLEIQKIIENEGFRLEKFDVFVQQDLGRQERREGFVPPDSRNSSASGRVEAPASTPPDSLPRTPLRMHSGSRYLDLFV
jgi:hypothetical protein